MSARLATSTSHAEAEECKGAHRSGRRNERDASDIVRRVQVAKGETPDEGGDACNRVDAVQIIECIHAEEVAVAIERERLDRQGVPGRRCADARGDRG